MDDFKQRLDNYITGGDYHEVEYTYKCEKCGHTWEVQGAVEYGGFQPFVEEDMDCPECGHPIPENQEPEA